MILGPLRTACASRLTSNASILEIGRRPVDLRSLSMPLPLSLPAHSFLGLSPVQTTPVRRLNQCSNSSAKRRWLGQRNTPYLNGTRSSSTSNSSTNNEPAQEQPNAKETQDENRQHKQHDLEASAKPTQIDLSAMLSKERTSTKSSTMAEIKRLARIARPERRWLAITFVLLAFASVVNMSIPYSIGKVLDVASKTDAADIQILGMTPNQFLLAFTCFLTVGCAVSFGKTMLLRMIGERVIGKLRSQLYRRTFVQDAEFFDANRVGDLLSRLTSDATIVGKSVTQNIDHGLSSLFVSIVGFSIMLWTSPRLTGMLLLMIPPGFLAATLYGNAVKNISKLMQKNLGSLSRIAEERLGGMRTSQAFVGEVQEVRRYNKQIRSVVSIGLKEARVNSTFANLAGWAGDIVIIGILVIGGNSVRSGAISVGELTSFMMYTVYTGAGLLGLSGFYSELMKGVGAAGRLFELQDRQPSTYPTAGKPVKSAQGVIEFKDVKFAYPTRPGVSIFNGLSFTIPSGGNVCIVGPSGGGKSTVAALLLRFYAPTSGSVTINGVDLREMNVKSLRRRIGMVSQEPVLFSGTVAENIAYGKPTASRAEIMAAARQANCSFIDNLPEGLNTEVGARGSQLSGGQKQRIAIARALLKDPDIVILDEATSALDAESETLVNEALGRLLRGRNTTISIAHRLSTIKRSDQIVVLDKTGKAVEVGAYEELSADPDSAFNKLMYQQMHGKVSNNESHNEKLAFDTEGNAHEGAEEHMAESATTSENKP